jgi:ribosomal protein L12E/L44/L45/RPP1/RPP2
MTHTHTVHTHPHDIPHTPMHALIAHAHSPSYAHAPSPSYAHAHSPSYEHKITRAVEALKEEEEEEQEEEQEFLYMYDILIYVEGILDIYD